LTAPSALTALLDEGLERGFFAGAAALVREPGSALAEIYRGEMRLEPESERGSVRPETLWDLASLTKPLAGAASVMALAEERQLSLDDEAGRFGDAFRATRFSGVTLRRLLSHQAGLQAWFPCYVRGEGRDAYRRTLSGVDPAGPPGRAVLYSCLGYLLLSEIVESVASQPLDRFFRERVTEPMGLAGDLLFSPEGADATRAAGGERDDATERRMVREKGLAYAGFRSGVVNGSVNDGNSYRRGNGVALNAGLFGTARAVAAMALAWLARDSRLLTEASIETALTNATPGAEEDRGLGWQMASTKGSAGDGLSPTSFGHTGFTGASLFVDPVQRRVFVLLSNRLHPDARNVEMNAFRRRFHALASAL
jgi:CubicO group peptidase (beta-lactamase class C family)